MKAIREPLTWTLSGLLLAGGAAPLLGDTQENPFKVIPQRNAFGLKEYVAPPPPPVQKPPEPPPTTIKLTGITRIGKVKRAHFAVEEPGKPGQYQYLNLTDDVNKGAVKEGDVEVLEIDGTKDTVKIRKAGSEMVLNFEKNGIKGAAPVAAVPSPLPGAPPHAGGPITTWTAPGSNPGAGPIVVSRAKLAAEGGGAGSSSGVVVSSTSAVPSPTMTGAGATYQARTAGGAETLKTIPTRSVRTTPSYLAPQTPPQPRISAEEQIILMEAQRLHSEKRGEVLPPTPGLPTTTAPPVP